MSDAEEWFCTYLASGSVLSVAIALAPRFPDPSEADLSEIRRLRCAGYAIRDAVARRCRAIEVIRQDPVASVLERWVAER